MSPVRFLVAPLLKQSECSAVGSALRSGRRGRAFESPHSDKIKGSFLSTVSCPFISIQSLEQIQDGYVIKHNLLYHEKQDLSLYSSSSFFYVHQLHKTQTTLSENEKTVNPPIMGWSSWNAFRVDISEDIIKHQADLMVKKGLKDAGYHYVNVDDGYFGKRDDNGIMHTHEQRFPNGMKPIADYVHGLGMKAGLYTDAGNNTCGSMWDNDAAGVGAGIYGHEPQDANYTLATGVSTLSKLITAEEMRWDLMKRNATLPSGTV